MLPGTACPNMCICSKWNSCADSTPTALYPCTQIHDFFISCRAGSILLNLEIQTPRPAYEGSNLSCPADESIVPFIIGTRTASVSGILIYGTLAVIGGVESGLPGTGEPCRLPGLGQEELHHLRPLYIISTNKFPHIHQHVFQVRIALRPPTSIQQPSCRHPTLSPAYCFFSTRTAPTCLIVALSRVSEWKARGRWAKVKLWCRYWRSHG